MNIIMFGKPGSGKSTHGKMLANYLNIEYFSMGEILRKKTQDGTSLGIELDEIMKKGALVNDDITINLISDHIQNPSCAHGFICDGFPRTMYQLEHLPFTYDVVLNIYISDKEALWRLVHRKEGRADDTVETILARIKLFHTVCDPLLHYFEQTSGIIRVEGEGTIEEVAERVKKAFDRYVNKES